MRRITHYGHGKNRIKYEAAGEKKVLSLGIWKITLVNVIRE